MSTITRKLNDNGIWLSVRLPASYEQKCKYVKLMCSGGLDQLVANALDQVRPTELSLSVFKTLTSDIRRKNETKHYR